MKSFRNVTKCLHKRLTANQSRPRVIFPEHLVLQVHLALRFCRPKYNFKPNSRKCIIWECVFKKLRFKNIENLCFQIACKGCLFKKRTVLRLHCNFKSQTAIYKTLNYILKTRIFKSHVLKSLFFKSQSKINPT